jgi:hypothetical protein
MDMTKGGVDMIVQMCNAYSIACVTQLWSVAVFFILMNMARNIFEELVHVANDAISYSKRQNKVTCSGYDSIPFAVSGTHGKGRYM